MCKAMRINSFPQVVFFIFQIDSMFNVAAPWRGEGAYLTKRLQSIASTRRARWSGCCNVQSQQTGLFYAIAKDLIQSWRILIRVASLSLVSFRHLSVKARGRIISYINVYHLFASSNYISIVFSPVVRRARVSTLEVKCDIFSYGNAGTW